MNLDEQLIVLFEEKLSNDNNTRARAEQKLEEINRQIPDTLVVVLLRLLRSTTTSGIRQQAVIHLKHLIKNNKSNEAASAYWRRLNSQTQQEVKFNLLDVLRHGESQRNIRDAIVDVITLLASYVSLETEWPDLKPQVFELLSSQNEIIKLCGLSVFGNLMCELLGSDISVVDGIVSSCFDTRSSELKFAAATLVHEVLNHYSMNQWVSLQFCIPLILRSIEEYTSTDMDTASELLVVMIDIATANPTFFFGAHLNDLVGSLKNIILNNNVEDRIQQLALEVFLSMIEKKPYMCDRQPMFIDEVIKILMECVSAVDDPHDWDTVSRIDDEDEGDEEFDPTRYDIAEGGLDRLAGALLESNVIHSIFEYARQYLSINSWRMCYAGLISIAQTVEHVADDYAEIFCEHVVRLCVPMLSHESHRVRHAACQAIGQASTDLSPLLQELYPREIIPPLVAALDDPKLRVQTHASRAITNFCEDVDSEDIKHYAETLINSLMRKCDLSQPKPLIRTSSTAIAVIAASCGEHFTHFYQPVVRAMKSIYSKFEGDSVCQEKAIECITLAALAVGKEKIEQSDLQECLNVVLQSWVRRVDISIETIQRREQEPKDDYLDEQTISQTLNESMCRIIKVLKTDLTPYLQHIIPRVITIISQSPEALDIEDLASSDVSLCGMLNGNATGMKSAATEEIEQMTEVLIVILASGADWSPYIAQVIESSIRLLTFQYCENIITNALTILAEGLGHAKQVADMGTNLESKMTSYNRIAQWLGTVIDNGLESMINDDEMQELPTDLPRGIANVIRNTGPNTSQDTILLNNDKIKDIVGKVYNILVHCSRLNMNEQEISDMDEDDRITYRADRNTRAEFGSAVIDILSAIVAKYNSAFMMASQDVTIKHLHSYFVEVKRDPRSELAPLDIIFSCYIIGELLQIPEQTKTIWEPFVQGLVHYVADQDPVLSQPAAHALKQLARSGLMGPDLVNMTAKQLVQCLEAFKFKQPLKRGTDKSCCDNIVAALGAVLLNHQAEVSRELNPSSLLSLWMHYLPLQYDETEAQWVHAEFINLVLMRNESVIGANFGNLPHIITVISTIYKKELSTPELDEKLLLVTQLLGDINPQLIGNLKKSQRKNLERLISDAKSRGLCT